MMNNSGKIVVFVVMAIALFLIMSTNWHSGIDSDEHNKSKTYVVNKACIVRSTGGNPVLLDAGEKVKIIKRNFLKDSEIFCLSNLEKYYIKDLKSLRELTEEEKKEQERKAQEELWREAIRWGIQQAVENGDLKLNVLNE